MFPNIPTGCVLGLDYETTGKYWWKDKVFGFAIAVGGAGGLRAYYDIRQTPQAAAWLKDTLPRMSRVVAHFAKFEAHFTREFIGLTNLPWACTMIDAALLDEHRLTYDLNSVGLDSIGVGKKEDIWEKLAVMFGGRATKEAQAPNLSRAPSQLVGEYAIQDVDTALRLHEWQEEQLLEQELTRVRDLERALLPIIVRMEHRGVRVDVDKTRNAIMTMSEAARHQQVTLNDLAGFEINPNPSGSIHKLFAPTAEAYKVRVYTDKGEETIEKVRWRLRDGTVADSTGGGKACLDAECLRRMRDPAAAMILKLRKLIKLRDTFLQGHILGHHHNGVIHANFNQTKSEGDVGTGTGRFSVSEPALQQIHKRDVDIAAVIRSLFLPDPGHMWDCRDYRQMDFRVMAHYVKSPEILSVYEQDPDADFHQIVSDLTGIQRKPRWAGDANAKQINLGMCFGMGEGRLAAEMGLPFEIEIGRNGKEIMVPGPEARVVFEKYHDVIPGIKSFNKYAARIARDRGYVKTIIGRRMRFPHKGTVYKAGGLIYQGSAAEALKVKLVEVDSYLETIYSRTGARILLNVHDEVDTSLPHDDTGAVASAEIGRIMEKFDGIDTPIHFRVPIRSSQGQGPNWWDACKE